MTPVPSSWTSSPSSRPRVTALLPLRVIVPTVQVNENPDPTEIVPPETLRNNAMVVHLPLLLVALALEMPSSGYYVSM